MKNNNSDIAFTPTVKAIQEQRGSRANYAETEEDPEWWLNRVTPELADFIAERDSFYLGTSSADGQPYIQHRGGPKGFLKVIDERTLAFADFSGNRQYISWGNLQDNDKAFIFLMDYTNRRRYKVWGTAKVVDDDPELMAKLADPDYQGRPERAFVFRIGLWDGNCPQHITPRYTEEEIQELEDCPCCDPDPGRFTGALEVSEVLEETANVKTFRMVNPKGGQIPFTYQPGQFLTLDIEPDGNRIRRSYTIASTPSRPECIEITVKREEQGLVSNYLHQEIEPGDTLKLSAPSGNFTFTGKEHGSIVLIAAGVGITPMMSVLRWLTDQGWKGEIFLILSFRNGDEFIFRNEIESLRLRHANVKVVTTMTRPGQDWDGPKGRITGQLISESVPDLVSHRFHICGPDQMMDDIKTMLTELAVPVNQIKLEAFGTAKRKPKSGSVDSPEVAINAKLIFGRSGESVPLPANESVLEVAEQNGIEIDNACRSGTCGSCKVKLRSGAVTMACEDALTAADKEKGIILACQAKSTTDVEIDR